MTTIARRSGFLLLAGIALAACGTAARHRFQIADHRTGDPGTVPK